MVEGISESYQSYPVNINWSVKLLNATDEPQVLSVTLTLMDEDNALLGTAMLSGRAGARESVTVSDTLILRSNAARRISAGNITISH